MSAGAASRAVRIAPSILTADAGRLEDAAADAEAGGADLWHLDVMDGHFVPAITFGVEMVALFRRISALPIEVHMMVSNPADQLPQLAAAGATRAIYHHEATAEPERLLAAARALGCEIGVAINPETPAASVKPLLGDLDEVVVMLIRPGRGGQQMMPEQLEKVRRLRAWSNALGTPLSIEVDGGVKAHNASECVGAGADLLVAGSAVFNDRETPQQALGALRSAIRAASHQPERG